VRDGASEAKGIAEAKEWKDEAANKGATVSFILKNISNG
jgi:hypothetical protein